MPLATRSHRPESIAQIVVRERINLERRVRDIAGNRHTDLAKAMRSYFGLSPSITEGCRIIEANKLFELAKNTGGMEEKDVVTSLLKQTGTHIYLDCECDDNECDEWYYEEEDENGDGSNNHCVCLDNGTFCANVRIYTELPNESIVYGGVDRRRQH